MALKTPSLFSAILALSQTHKEAGIETPAGPDSQLSLVQNFRSTSMQGLRRDLITFDPKTAEASLATILTLCLCEIHAGDYESKTWRVHFDGARAVLAAIGRSADSTSVTRGSTYEFLERWYVSIEALAALTAKGLPKGPLRVSGGIEPIVESIEGTFIDDYLGKAMSFPYSTIKQSILTYFQDFQQISFQHFVKLELQHGRRDECAVIHHHKERKCQKKTSKKKQIFWKLQLRK